MRDRPTFRRRLVGRLGVALAAALALVGVAAWGAVAAWATHDARAALRAEIHAVEHAVVGRDGALHPERYDWDEPHHRFASRRIDPYFVQLFDPRGTLILASDNTAGGPLPPAMMPLTDADRPLEPLARLPDRRFYRATETAHAPDGRPIAVVQVARYVPPAVERLPAVAGTLALGLGALLAALLALVAAIGGRVVGPLARITAHAAALSPATLGERVPVPPDADRETAVLAATLNDALGRLDVAFDQMQRFTADAAHELQTPLTVLRGHIDVTMRRERSPDVHRETLGVLAAQVDAMTATVRGLLALARLDAGAAPGREPVDLADLARAEVEAARPAAEARGLALDLRAMPAPVVGHSDLLREVMRALLDNAVKYTPAGRVVVATGVDGGEAWLAVEDSGPGLAPEHRARAADRFWRAPGTQHLPGSGLGLALAHRIAERHGGTLDLADGADGGLRATVRLLAVFPLRPPA